MNKKKIFTIVGVVLFVAILICSMFVKTDGTTFGKDKPLAQDASQVLENAQTESSKVEESEKGEFHQINIDTYLTYLNGEEAKLILIARPTCHYCQIAEPIIQKIIHDYNVEINYLNTDNFQGDDQANFINSNEAFKEGFGTPMLLLVQNNKIVDSIDGLTDTAHYLEFMKKYKFVK